MSEAQNKELNQEDEAKQGRREFLKHVATTSVAALVAAPGAAVPSTAADNPDADVTVAEYFQGHFLLMTDEEKKKAIARP